MASVNDQLLQNRNPPANEADESTDEPAELEGNIIMAQRGENANEGGGYNAVSPAEAKRTAINEQEEKKGPESETSLSFGTSKLLKTTLYGRIFLSSWGISSLYVYFHMFVKNILGNRLFAPLGSEMREKPGMTVAERDKEGRRHSIEITMLVLFLSVIWFFIFLLIASFISLITEVIENPLAAAAQVFGLAWSWVANFLKSMFK
ncbi:MAG: hypothetical protein EOM88_02825 [Clostridia bacterium]|nr:hypothetical protein [Clostridia bacterium]